MLTAGFLPQGFLELDTCECLLRGGGGTVHRAALAMGSLGAFFGVFDSGFDGRS